MKINKGDKEKNCSVHGFTLFRLRENKKGQWFSCEKCLQMQWRKARNKRATKEEVKLYQKNYAKEFNKIRKSLSVYLTMILIALERSPK
jgi:hypothetical protein